MTADNTTIALRREIVCSEVFQADLDSTLTAMLITTSGELSRLVQAGAAERRIECIGKYAAVLHLLTEHFRLTDGEVERACIEQLTEIRDFIRK